MDPNQSHQENTTETLEIVLEDPTKQPLYRFVTGELKTTPPCDDWIQPLKQSPDQLCLRFPSWDGAHYVRYHAHDGFKAVYAGPHGPENRPADIDRENIARLLETADSVEIVPIADSPFASVEVTSRP